MDRVGRTEGQAREHGPTRVCHSGRPTSAVSACCSLRRAAPAPAWQVNEHRRQLGCRVSGFDPPKPVKHFSQASAAHPLVSPHLGLALLEAGTPCWRRAKRLPGRLGSTGGTPSCAQRLPVRHGRHRWVLTAPTCWLLLSCAAVRLWRAAGRRHRQGWLPAAHRHPGAGAARCTVGPRCAGGFAGVGGWEVGWGGGRPGGRWALRAASIAEAQKGTAQHLTLRVMVL